MADNIRQKLMKMSEIVNTMEQRLVDMDGGMDRGMGGGMGMDRGMEMGMDRGMGMGMDRGMGMGMGMDRGMGMGMDRGMGMGMGMDIGMGMGIDRGMGMGMDRGMERDSGMGGGMPMGAPMGPRFRDGPVRGEMGALRIMGEMVEEQDVVEQYDDALGNGDRRILDFVDHEARCLRTLYVGVSWKVNKITIFHVP